MLYNIWWRNLGEKTELYRKSRRYHNDIFGKPFPKGRIFFSPSNLFSGLSFNSTILTAFLAPAVGNDAKWLLCYRASIHGWAVSTFHNRCDGKRDTVTIIRNGPYVFGGYTDIPWDGNFKIPLLFI